MAKESRDQRRKKKLAEERRKARLRQSSAYLGEKYKTEELVPAWMHAEIGIYQTYVISDRTLLDRTVEEGLEKLIGMMRTGSLPPLPDTGEIRYEEGREADFLIESIRRCWAQHFATAQRPPRDDLIGVLRTILGSVEKVKSPDPSSQSYLHHIAGFLTKKLGIRVEAVAADRTPLPGPDEGELVRLGRQWSAGGPPEARAAFLELAAYRMSAGQTSRVIDDCHLLVGEISEPSSVVVSELVALIKKARESLRIEMG
ncbi:MAG TPA: hypothetical protein VH092_10800 [Urbifossiella sp.]|nr:hypothetical protein [Urbifossiella sp.]